MALTLLALLVAHEPEAELSFANALLAEGDHYRAIGAYKEFLHLAPDSPLADEARLSIGRAYVRGEQPAAAQAYYRSLASRSPEWMRRALLEGAHAAYVAGEYQAAEKSLRSWLRAGPDVDAGQQARARYLLAWSLLQQDQARAAESLFRALPHFEGQAALAQVGAAWERLPERSPLVAGLLSVVPGAGHFYVGEPVTGLAALTLNGVFGFALYQTIRERRLGLSLILGMMESLWYTGTVFGAVSSAHKFNRDVRNQARERLRDPLEDAPESWPPLPKQP